MIQTVGAQLRRAFRTSWFVTGASLLVTGLALWLLAREIEWGMVAAALAGAEYLWVAVGVLATVGTFFARAWRWQALLWQADLPLLPTMTALLVGQVANLVLPLRGGDLVRAAWVGPARGTDAPEALGSVALEKVWDLVGLLLCGLVLLPLVSLPVWFARSTWSTAATLVVGGVVLWVGLRWQEFWFGLAERLLARFPAWAQGLLGPARRLIHGLESIRHSGASARAFVWTVVKWGLGAVTNWAVMRAFGVASVPAAIFLLATLMVGGVVVPTPGRLGIFEGIAVVSLAVFGVPDDRALAVGLVLHLVVMGSPLVTAALLALLPQSYSGRDDEQS